MCDDGGREHNPPRDLPAAGHVSGAIDHARADDDEGHHDAGACDHACGYDSGACDHACGYHSGACDHACGYHSGACDHACGYHSGTVHNTGPVYDGEAEAPPPPSR
ncbi:MAG: hypothetical protein ABSF58_09155 [Solirubrobacteraceae bacterium]